MSIVFLQFLLGVVFSTVVFLHLTKKEVHAAVVYGIQSAAVMLIFLNSYLATNNFSILLVVLLILAVKVLAAPLFFLRLIKKQSLTFSVNTYLNAPLSLLIIAALTFMAHSRKFAPLTNLIPANQALLALALASIFVALFLIVNRKGALAQIIGVLSLENSIVAFMIFAGLEQSPFLQIGVICNIFVWVVIATVFVSMIYEHFGSHDVTAMQGLRD